MLLVSMTLLFSQKINYLQHRSFDFKTIFYEQKMEENLAGNNLFKSHRFRLSAMSAIC